MTGESNNAPDIGESLDVPATEKKDSETIVKKQKGVISRIWNQIFRVHGDDFEKRLQHIFKEEAAVLARMKKRSRRWRRMTRHVIIFSVIFEFIAVGYAIMTTRSLELNWKMRALRVLPMFLLPVLSSITYSAVVTFTRICDRKDQKTLERLRAERQEKINELKEKTNYYTTQQLIQRYDTDPAAKAAAATVLASKLGSDSGLKVYVGDESKLNAHAPIGRSNDVEFVHSSGLRNRKQSLTRSRSTGGTVLQQHWDEEEEEEILHNTGNNSPEITSNLNQMVVEHHPGSTTALDGGWFARIAALLVGEDPTQCYALICGNCHKHNGLARKEDFPYITYYCPHCNALNGSKHPKGVSGSDLPGISSLITGGDIDPINNIGRATMTHTDMTPVSSSPVALSAVETDTDMTPVSSSPVALSAVETIEGSETVVSGVPDPVS